MSLDVSRNSNTSLHDPHIRTNIKRPNTPHQLTLDRTHQFSPFPLGKPYESVNLQQPILMKELKNQFHSRHPNKQNMHRLSQYSQINLGYDKLHRSTNLPINHLSLTTFEKGMQQKTTSENILIGKQQPHSKESQYLPNYLSQNAANFQQQIFPTITLPKDKVQLVKGQQIEGTQKNLSTIFPNPQVYTSKNILAQLSIQNQYLSEQVLEYKKLVAKLEQELATKDELLKSHQILKQQLEVKCQLVQDQMRVEILTLLKKQDLLKKHQRALLQADMNDSLDDSKLWQVVRNIESLLIRYGADREPGFLMKKCSKSDRYLDWIVPNIERILKRNKKLESFANCIQDMKQKITGREDCCKDLKESWRWLKRLFLIYVTEDTKQRYLQIKINC